MKRRPVMKRRAFLTTALTALVAACTPEVHVSEASPTQPEAGTEPPATATTAVSTTSTQPELPEEVKPLSTEPIALSGSPFQLGVASGDPTATSVMLWTKLSGDLPPSVPLVWEVADSNTFESLVATGRKTATEAVDRTVRVDVPDLPAGSQLFYRFRVGEETSPIGRTRTFAPPGESTPPLRLAVSSCQAATDGAYAAHQSIAEADVDAVLWLGDYIYGESTTLEEYRSTYDSYRSDPALQAAHAAHPWIMIWDDHEVKNDFDSSVEIKQRQAAFQAWRENQPVRMDQATAAGLQGYRSFVVGDLCRIIMLDARQYSTAGSPNGSILGDAQRNWLGDELQQEAAWMVVASPVLASGLSAPVDGVLLPYTWDGAADDRSQLASRVADQDAIIVSGDLHTAMALDFRADPNDAESTTVAPEFMAPAISSAFPQRFESFAPFLGLFNDHLNLIDTRNGWLHLELSVDRVVATYHFVDDVADPQSALTTGNERFEVRRGDATSHRLP